MNRSRSCVALLSAAALCLLLLPGCGVSSSGSRSSWGLWNQESSTAFSRLRETARLLDGGNDTSDIVRTGRLMTSGSQGSFRMIGQDLRKTFAPSFSFEDLRSTFRLLD